MSTANAEQLRTWEKKLVEELASLRQRQREIESQLQRGDRELELIRQILSLGQPENAEASLRPQGPKGKPTSISVKESVKTILQEAGRPLHISEIHREFLRRGLPIPGGGTPFNILVHIAKDQGFIRIARGTYVLREGYQGSSAPELAREPKHRRKRRKRKTRVRAEHN